MEQGKPINLLRINGGRESARATEGFVGKGKWKKRRLQCNVEDRNIIFHSKEGRLPFGLMLQDNLKNF